MDFPKTGIIPEALTTESVNGFPPERVEVYPNFMVKRGSPSYPSVRLLGQLFNRCKEIEDIIYAEQLNEFEQTINMDDCLLISGDSWYVPAAEVAYKEYSNIIGVCFGNLIFVLSINILGYV